MFRILVAASALLLFTACDTSNVAPDAGFAGNSNVQGRMAGEMPVTGGFDHGLRTGNVWKGQDYLEFDLHVLGNEGWVMLGGGFEPSQMPGEGESVTLDPDEHWVFGCSGPDEWQADFDEPADEVVVSKEVVEIEGQEMMEVTITAVFPGSGEVTAVVLRPTNGNDNNDG